MSLWESESSQQAQEVITVLLAARTETGWVSCYENTFRMRALQVWSGNKIEDDNVIMKVLTRMKDRGLSTIQDFKTVRSEILAEWARESNTQRTQWEFFIPLIAKLADDVSRPAGVLLLDTPFVWDKWQAVEGKIGTENIDRALTDAFLNIKQRPEICISLQSEGIDPIDSWNSLIPTFDLFRGILEYGYGFGRRSMIIGGGNESRRTIFPVPEWFLARDAKQSLKVLRFDIHRPAGGNVQELSAQGFNQIVKVAKRFASPPDKRSTNALLADAFRLYAQALDEPFRHTCLLGLWQMAEALTLSNRGDTKIVCARLAAAVEKRMQPPPTGLSKILEDIANKRNRMVHCGIHDVDDDDINILKLICEMALWSVMQATDKLPTKEHLSHFLTLSCRTTTDLRTMGEALKWVFELEEKLSSANSSESA